LVRFRVLDPACGSGNFLYIAFRELYRLDTELLSRMREFPSTKDKLSWNSGISTTNFFGIDINPFAVELAKVTLNIAKKIAFEERKEQAFALAGQVEMEMDPSLPLDNLDKNVVCADALFTDWPEVEAIVGNPPFLGERKLRGELGAVRFESLKAKYPGVGGDLYVYWFRRAHDQLQAGGRAGLVANSNIRVGGNRLAALDYIVRNAGTITNAVSERDWPGEAALHVSMVNWHKGRLPGPHELVVGDQVFACDVIQSHLQLHADASGAKQLRVCQTGTSQGIIWGTKAFYVDTSTALQLCADPKAAPFVQAVANGDDVLGGSFESEPAFAIHLGEMQSEAEASNRSGTAFTYAKVNVLPKVEAKAKESSASDYSTWLRAWWRPLRPRRDFLDAISHAKLDRIIACSRLAARSIFFFLTTNSIVPLERLQLFAFADDYSFGILQTSHHWNWTMAKGGRREERIEYSTEVWRTFPWPQDPTDEQVTAVVAASRNLRRVRAELMETNGWSLRQLYQSAEVPGPHPLNDAQAALDAAVNDAYGLPPNQDPLEFLLELNQLVAEDEAAGRTVRGPGLPPHLDPKDPRWTSTDCIQPPPPT
jgi:SAM-dependent methyltransferase